jgi:capsular exopolysaccharide synthesis family protein
LDLRRQIAIARAWLPLFIASALLAGGVAFAVSGVLPKVYEAKVALIVGQSLSAANPDYSQLLVSQRLSATYAQVAMTRPILESVLKQLGLDQPSDELAKRVRADAAPDSTLLTITVQDADPAWAAAIANALAANVIGASPAIQGRESDEQATIDADLVATHAQIDVTQAEVVRLAGRSAPTPADLTRLDTLQARLISLRSIYAALLSFSSGNSSNLLSVLEPAVAPVAPVSPKPLLNTLVAMLVGLLIALGVVSVIEYLDDAVKDPEVVEEVAGLSTLGTIPKIKGDRGRSEIYRLATLLYPRSAAAEAYRTLRTNIEFASLDEPVRTLLITSAGTGEGKTVTAANLAVVFAQTGWRVLLVDADLRKPGAHLIFNLPNTDGLTTLLRSDELSLDTIAQPTEIAGLRVLTTGQLPANPAELLGSHRMRKVLDRLIADADLLILDGPPLRAVTDSAILSSLVDGTLLVIDASRSQRPAVRQGREALERAGAHVLGAVINRMAGRTQPQYGDYYGHYGDDSTPADGSGVPAPGTEPSGSAR